MSNRPKVGPADPETRRKKLREILDTPTKATGVAAKKPTMKDAVDKGVQMGSDKPGKKKLVRRFGPEGKTEEEMGL
jgi:hypothetical protein